VALYQLAAYYLDEGRVSHAIQLGRAAVAGDPCNADAWDVLVDAYEEAGDHDQAAMCRARAAEARSHGVGGGSRAPTC
jgi:Tfp pilus assembly protein PilF